MPAVIGRENCHVRNVYFTNCHFTQIERASIEGHEDGPFCRDHEFSLSPCFRRVDNLVLQDTAFSVL